MYSIEVIVLDSWGDNRLAFLVCLIAYEISLSVDEVGFRSLSDRSWLLPSSQSSVGAPPLALEGAENHESEDGEIGQLSPDAQLSSMDEVLSPCHMRLAIPCG